MAIALAMAAELGAQTGTVTPFEVASIRSHDPHSPGATMRFMPGGRLVVSGMSIKNLIRLAYGFGDDGISSHIPNWLDSDLYDIDAKPPSGGSPAVPFMAEQYERIRALLADRCQLKVHRETKIALVYVLTVAKGGLKMQGANGTDPRSDAKGTILPWDLFAKGLSQRLGRPVIDKTGLKGAW
jgi:uncharacterized protein (TIGR03435 family)